MANDSWDDYQTLITGMGFGKRKPVLLASNRMPWSATYQLLAPDGRLLWLKANSDRTRGLLESRILQELGRSFSSNVPKVIGSSEPDGAFLMGDAGKLSRPASSSACRAVAATMCSYLNESSVGFMIPQLVPADLLRVLQGTPASAVERLFQGSAGKWKESLASIDHMLSLPSGLAAILDRSESTVIHGDLHDGNLFVNSAGTPVVLDWADAVRTSPEVELGQQTEGPGSFASDFVRSLKGLTDLVQAPPELGVDYSVSASVLTSIYSSALSCLHRDALKFRGHILETS